MATRQERLDDRLKGLQEIQKKYPDMDLNHMIAAVTRNVHFEFDVKETLGEDTWTKMNEVLRQALSLESPSGSQVGLAEARACLRGNGELEERFDSIYKNVGPGTVALADDIAAQATAT
ncbi:hypothetical protein E4U41_002555 [Claviceps citrina]|nr:hypothetical protein E4U41_002555 [Claviceps citrina]